VAKVTYQDLGELAEVSAQGIGKAIIIPAKDALRQLRFALTGNLTIRDNMYAAIITLGYSGNSSQTLTHGVEYTFQNPLKTTPIGFTPIKSFQPSGSTALPVQSAAFNTTRTDGLMGVTVQFAPPQHKLSVQRTTGTQSIPNNVGTDVTWDAEEFSYGDIVYTAAGVFTMPQDGLIHVSWDLPWSGAGVAAGDAVGGHFHQRTSTKRYAQTRVAGPTATSARVNASDYAPVLANETFALQAVQVNAGLAAKDLSANTTTNTMRLQIVYVAPPSDYSALVTGILWGG
jgi:hypothetical protein